MSKKFEVVESLGDNISSDVELDRKQLMLVGKLQKATLALEQKQEEFAQYLDELKKREDEIKNLKEAMYDLMTEEGAKKIESDFLIFTVVQPNPRFSIDHKKLEAVNPALFAQVKELAGKESSVKGYVKITPKKNGGKK